MTSGGTESLLLAVKADGGEPTRRVPVRDDYRADVDAAARASGVRASAPTAEAALYAATE